MSQCFSADRCINSSGVLRYQTSRGWVSELTRGHGRENITEILDVSSSEDALPPISAGSSLSGEVESKRIECGVPDLRSVGASVLARLHGSQVSRRRKCWELWLLFQVLTTCCCHYLHPTD